MKTTFFHVALLLWGLSVFGQESQTPLASLPSPSEGANARIRSAFLETDVLVIGEEHNDKPGHNWKLDLFRQLVFHAGNPSSLYCLSLEMLETDQNPILQEYWRGEISEASYLKGTVHWNNYKTDYHPLVAFAKENRIPVIPANPPRRYVSLVSQAGLSGLRSLDVIVLSYLPPLYTLELWKNPNYEVRLRDLFSAMGQHHGTAHLKGNSPSTENMILAQHLWDAGMSHQIAQTVRHRSCKVFHINGRFHSDYGGGVPYRLRQMGLKVVTVSLRPSDAKTDTSEGDSPIADFEIFADTLSREKNGIQQSP